MRLSAVVVLLTLSACTAVQSRVRGDIDLSKDGAPEIYKYEAVESHSINGTAAVCAFTFFIYGGGCWAYLATPYSDQEQEAIRHAKEEVAAMGCGELKVSRRAERAGYDVAPRTSRVTDAFGQPISQRELAERCAKKKSEAPAATSQSQ